MIWNVHARSRLSLVYVKFGEFWPTWGHEGQRCQHMDYGPWRWANNWGFNELAAYADAQLNHGTPGLEKSQRFIDRPYHHRILQVSLALAWNRLPSCTQLWHFYLATVVLLFSFWGKGLLCSFFFTVITNQS